MSARTVLPQAVYRRARDPRELPDDLRLMALEWALFFAVTGTHTVGELGRQMRAGELERDAAFGRLARLGLIEEQELGAAEYVRALAAAGTREERTLHEFLMNAAPPAAVSVENEEGGAVSDHETSAEPRLRQMADMAVSPSRIAARSGRVAPPLAFKRLPSPDEVTKENRLMSRSRRLSLRALMNLIEKQAGSREAGQLDIYRVFVRVDTVLLRRSGIETLRFTEDHLVSDPELEQAIIRSVKKTLGLDCPETIWVEVT
ncbi:MAG: hypothetical protein ACYC7A_19855 [Thermoanaerobaculia bacterium]